MGETRARRRIRLAVESRGYSVESLDWEPIYNAGEMAGYAGGWSLEVDRSPWPNVHPGTEFFGESVDELLAEIDWALAPKGACTCDRSHHPLTAAGLIDDPQKPTHGKGCEFNISYRLRWWRDVQDEGVER